MLLFLLGSAFALILSLRILIPLTVFGFVVGISWYFHLKKRNSYFAKIGIPSPPISSLFLGNLPEYEKDRQQCQKLIEWEKIYGDTFGIYEGSHKVIVISDPEIINQVFIKQFHAFRSRKLLASSTLDQQNDGRANLFLSEGNRWKRLRALISSCLTVHQIKALEPLMPNVMNDLVKSIDEKESENADGIVDLKPQLLEMGFAFISRAALGFKEKFCQNEMLKELLVAFGQGNATESYTESFFAGTYEFRRITQYLKLLFSSICKIIAVQMKIKGVLDEREKETEEQRKARPQDLIDFLSASYVNPNEIEDSRKPILDIKVQKKLTRVELGVTGVMFLVAGTDTTANTTTFVLYDLAVNQDIQQQVFDEIDGHIQSDEDLTYHKIKEMEFLDRVVKESSRLHPIVSGIVARRARETTTVTKSDGSTLLIEEGICVMANIPAIHMNEKFWGSNPEKFDPDQFLPENVATRPTVAWLAFGAGPRVCPGAKLALFEVKLAVIQILKKYRIEVCAKTGCKTKMNILLSVESMNLKLSKRA